jgi:hypothetical protein
VAQQAEELGVYRETFRELHGVEATAPIVGTWTYVDDDPD